MRVAIKIKETNNIIKKYWNDEYYIYNFLNFCLDVKGIEIKEKNIVEFVDLIFSH